VTPRRNTDSTNWGGSRGGGRPKLGDAKRVTVAVSLPPALVERMRVAAEERGASVSGLVEMAIAAHLDAM
jgi:hypothetical protein